MWEWALRMNLKVISIERTPEVVLKGCEALDQPVSRGRVMRLVFVFDLVFSIPEPHVIPQLILQHSYKVGSICNIIPVLPSMKKKKKIRAIGNTQVFPG